MSSVAPDLLEHIVAWRAWEIIVFHDTVTVPAGEVGEWPGWEDISSPSLSLRSAELRQRKVQLVSLNGVPWEQGAWINANCGVSGRSQSIHEAPGDQCRCGIYAARDLDHLLQLGYVSHSRVFGSVALAGKVRVGEYGFRAARARPLEVYVSVGIGDALNVPADVIARLIAEAYQCTATPIAENPRRRDSRIDTAARMTVAHAMAFAKSMEQAMLQVAPTMDAAGKAIQKFGDAWAKAKEKELEEIRRMRKLTPPPEV